jgi:hypothetical protein
MTANEKTLTIELERIGARDSSPTELMSALPATGCRYAIYDHDYTRPDGRPASKLFLVCWVPMMAKPSSRMFYTSQKSKVAPSFDGIETLPARGAADIEVVIGGRAKGTRDAGPAAKTGSSADTAGGATASAVGTGSGAVAAAPAADDDEDDPFADDEEFE